MDDVPFNNSAEQYPDISSSRMIPGTSNDSPQPLPGMLLSEFFPGTFDYQFEQVHGQSATYPIERLGALAAPISQHDGPLPSDREPLYRYHTSTEADRFNLLKIMQSIFRMHETANTMDKAFWATVANNLNEQTMPPRSALQVRNMFNNMKSKASKYKRQLRKEGEALETDKVSQFLLKMMEEQDQKAYVTMQQFANICNQDSVPSIPGPSTSTLVSVALNFHQTLEDINETSHLVNEPPLLPPQQLQQTPRILQFQPGPSSQGMPLPPGLPVPAQQLAMQYPPAMAMMGSHPRSSLA